MNPLEDKYAWYETSLDAYEAYERFVNAEFLQTHIPRITKEETLSILYQAMDELEDYAVLSLFATFEAYIVNNIRDLLEIRLGTTSMRPSYERKLYKYATKRSSQRVRFREDIIGLFAVEVPNNVLESTRTIFDYRNWVAHGKSWPTPPIVDAPTTYHILTTFLSDAGLI